MPLLIVRNDITKMKVDAIVNAADPSLRGDGGLDGQLRRAAGPALSAQCEKLGGCAPGQAKRTGAGRLPCKTVIHTVGPRWIDGLHGEEETLRSCYQSALRLALEAGCETVAFPLIAAGAFGCPKDRAIRTAVDAIGEFLSQADLTVYLVLFGEEAFQIGRELYDSITAYIDQRYVDARTDPLEERRRRQGRALRPQVREERFEAPPPPSAAASSFRPPLPQAPLPPAASGTPKKQRLRDKLSRKSVPPLSQEAVQAAPVPQDLDRALAQLDESFSQMLLRKIDESGMTDAQFYRRANMDRKLFSKIRSSVTYRPSKPTAVASAIALELSLEETRELLMKAGFALSHSSKFDIIVEFFISQGNYSILQINEALFAFDQVLLGV